MNPKNKPSEEKMKKERIPLITLVVYNGEDWIIVENNEHYKLMPRNCVQNNGKTISPPIGTIFQAGIGSCEYFEYLHNLNRFEK